MAARELIVLGTASQVPTRHRNHNGYFLRWDDEGLLFDPGEGTQRQMIRAGVTTSQITRLLVTHFHGDHCLGFASLCQRISLDRVPHAIAVCYPAEGQRYLERLRWASIYDDRAHLEPCPIEADGPIVETAGFTLEARRLDHPVATFGFRLQEPEGRRMLPEELARRGIRGPAVGQLIERGALEVGGRRVTLEEVSAPRPGQSMAFVMDTRVCEAAYELARDVDLLVIESTYPAGEEQRAHERSHLTSRQAATIAAEAGARRVVLTHFSQTEPRTARFLEQARALHPDVVAARDGDRIEVPPRRDAR